VRRHDTSRNNVKIRHVDFYAARLAEVSSVHELTTGSFAYAAAGAFLFGGGDLADGADDELETCGGVPMRLPIGGQRFALTYAYTPGEEQDGVPVFEVGFQPTRRTSFRKREFVE